MQTYAFKPATSTFRRWRSKLPKVGLTKWFDVLGGVISSTHHISTDYFIYLVEVYAIAIDPAECCDVLGDGVKLFIYIYLNFIYWI